MKDKRYIIILIVSLFSFIMIVGGISYGYFSYNRNVSNIQLDTGSISINLADINGNLSISNVVSMSDYQGINNPTYVDFTVDATVDIEQILYEIQIIPKSDNTLDSTYAKVYLTDQEENILLSPFSYTELVNSENNEGKVLYQEIISSNNNETTSYTKDFRLRIWIDKDCPDITSKTFAFDINLYAYNVDESKYEKVTFNTQDERIGLAKYVALGEEYGELPTPTREGYTFKGWNGKNLFKMKYTTSKVYGLLINYDEQTNIVNMAGIPNDGDRIYSFRFCVSYIDDWNENIKIKMFEVNLNGVNVRGVRLADHWYDGTIAIDAYFEEGNQYDLQFKVMAYLGDAPTAYEPYYITSETNVVQNQNHTLKAIWQENS